MIKESLVLILVALRWIVEGGNSALCILTFQPPLETIEFARQLSADGQNYGLDVYLVIDDESSHFSSSDIRLLNISREECYSHGYFKTTSFGSKRLHVVAWDKSLYYFCVLNLHYSFVWFTETDVFIPDVRSFRSLHQLYSNNSDLVISKNTLNRFGNSSYWQWSRAVGKLVPPWSRSMVNTVGLSRRLLTSIADYIHWRGESAFHEFFFLTLAIQSKMIIRTPLEMSTVVYRQNITWERIEKQPNNLWHAMKNSSQRQIWREKYIDERCFSSRERDLSE